MVEFNESQTSKVKDLQLRIADLERSLGQKQMTIDFLEKLIELAKQQYNIDIKKTQTPRNLVVPRPQRKRKL